MDEPCLIYDDSDSIAPIIYDCSWSTTVWLQSIVFERFINPTMNFGPALRFLRRQLRFFSMRYGRRASNHWFPYFSSRASHTSLSCRPSPPRHKTGRRYSTFDHETRARSKAKHSIAKPPPDRSGTTPRRSPSLLCERPSRSKIKPTA